MSVIIRTKDRLPLLKRCLESVMAQTYSDWEGIVINVGKAEVDEVVSHFGRFKLLRCEGLNVSEASNTAIAASSKKYITHLDDDDTWEPTFLEETVNFLEKNPGFGGVASYAHRIRERGDQRISKELYPLTPKGIYFSDLVRQNKFTNNAFLFRREIYDKVGGYNEEITLFEDWEYHIRFALEADIGLIPKPLANYHFRVGGEYANQLGEEGDKEGMLKRFKDYFLRKEVKGGTVGVGHLMHLEELHQENIIRMERLNYKESSLLRPGFNDIKKLLAKK